MAEKVVIPEGWKPIDFSEKNVEMVNPGPQTGEDEYHSKYVDPEGKSGGVIPSGGEKPSYSGEEGDQVEPEGDEPYDVGQLHLEDKEVVVEDGRQRGYHYYLVTHPDKEYFYSVIPKVRGTKETYRSPHKSTRKEALEAAYKVLNVSLPQSISDQMHYIYPEAEF